MWQCNPPDRNEKTEIKTLFYIFQFMGLFLTYMHMNVRSLSKHIHSFHRHICLVMAHKGHLNPLAFNPPVPGFSLKPLCIWLRFSPNTSCTLLPYKPPSFEYFSFPEDTDTDRAVKLERESERLRERGSECAISRMPSRPPASHAVSQPISFHCR